MDLSSTLARSAINCYYVYNPSAVCQSHVTAPVHNASRLAEMHDHAHSSPDILLYADSLKSPLLRFTPRGQKSVFAIRGPGRYPGQKPEKVIQCQNK